MKHQGGKVYLVGAGPGAVDLLTIRGMEVLRNAEVVVYDYLVSPDLLAAAPAAAELIFAGKKTGTEERRDQGALNRLLIERAGAGKRVVRLKGGDPFIFGRGGEEASALAAAGVEFEVVPGVTSAIAVPAFAGIPLTHREHGSFVAFVTGHEDQAKGSRSAIPWADLARAARGGGTLVLLMATAKMRASLERLVAGGLPGETPAAAIQSGTTAAQKTVLATIATLADEAERAGIGAPTVVVVGECAAMRKELAWFEKLPLFGRRIVVTRARGKSSAFARELRAMGAEVLGFPTIETAPPDCYDALDAALARLCEFDWIIFTSAIGVESFIARLRTLGRDIREIGARTSIGAIGPATAANLREHALTVAVTPAEYRAEAIAEAIGADRIRGARFLIPRAQVAREALPQMLERAGAREVAVVAAYSTVKPKNAQVDRMRELIGAGQIDLVTFTSSSTVSNFCDLLGPIGRGLKAAAIGPITAETARARGFEVVVSPAEYTSGALAAAIVDYFRALP
ncbi:MAG: uroporphyrinogen-III C-methyltransferase [Candidatus Binatales bacterium]